MLFYQEYSFTTEYTNDEVIGRVKQMKEYSDNRVWQFEGVVKANTFTLSPIFYSGHEYRFRPELHGIIVPDIKGSKISLKLRIASTYRILLYVMFILSFFIWLSIIYDRKNIELKFIDLRVGYPIAALASLIMLLVDFYQNGNRALQILINKLKLKKI